MSNMKKVGALWSRVAKSGKPFITGIIDRNQLPETEKVSVVVFENTNRQSEKSPNYLMFLSGPAVSKSPQGDMFSSPGSSEGFDDKDDIPF
jgi:hypothetical protein